MPALDASQSFLINHETIFFSPSLSTEDFNNIFSAKDPHITLAINCSNILISNSPTSQSNESEQRMAHGIRFIQLRNLFESGTCPSSGTKSKLHLMDTKSNQQDLLPINEAVLLNKTKILENGKKILADEYYTTIDDNDQDDDDEANVDDFWDDDKNSTTKNISQRCLLHDESYVISTKA